MGTCKGNCGNLRHGYSAAVRRLAALGAALLLVGGCSQINPLPQLPLEWSSPEERHIASLMQWHSGRVEVYRDFATIFTARAVYLSEQVQGLTMDWEARTRLLDPEEKKALADRVLGPTQGQMVFLLGLYTFDEDENRLDEGDSPLKVYLRYPDGKMIRAACVKAGDEERKIHMRFLQWDLSWSKLYRISFPRDAGAADGEGVVRILITGPDGQGEMALRTSPPPAPKP